MCRNFERIVRQKVALRLLDYFKKTNQVQLYNELKDTQWLPKSDLEAMQINKLRSLLIHAYENVPYYTKLFNALGFKPDRFQHFDDLLKIPVLTKKEVRKNFEMLKAKNINRFFPRLKQTSGSAGEPLVYYQDRSSHSCAWANNWRAFSLAGFKLGEPIAILSGGSLMPKPEITPLKYKIYYALMGAIQLPAYHFSEKVMKDYITILKRKYCPNYLYSYASASHLFARYLLKQQISDISFKAIFTTSEVLSHEQRETIQKAFNCPVFDTYGNNEGSIYAFECELHKGMHYSMEHSYLEILDANNCACKDGETGHIIVTNTANYAMPFIRYDTGDLGIITNENCNCGRGLKMIKKIIGRSRDFILTPDGRKVHGAFFGQFEPFYNISWIVSYHVLQETVDHITISLFSEGEPVQADIENMRSLLTKALGKEIKIDFVIDKTPKITQTGKKKLVESFVSNAEL